MLFFVYNNVTLNLGKEWENTGGIKKGRRRNHKFFSRDPQVVKIDAKKDIFITFHHLPNVIALMILKN